MTADLSLLLKKPSAGRRPRVVRMGLISNSKSDKFARRAFKIKAAILKMRATGALDGNLY